MQNQYALAFLPVRADAELYCKLLLTNNITPENMARALRMRSIPAYPFKSTEQTRKSRKTCGQSGSCRPVMAPLETLKQLNLHLSTKNTRSQIICTTYSLNSALK
jgi:hypothetical protein